MVCVSGFWESSHSALDVLFILTVRCISIPANLASAQLSDRITISYACSCMLVEHACLDPGWHAQQCQAMCPLISKHMQCRGQSWKARQ